MRIGKGKTDPNTGSIDGGTGRGVRIVDEEEETPIADESDAFAVLDNDDDANPGDRRRDPLRRP
jgi:hypothetical protein